MFQCRVEVCLSFRWRDVADGFEEAPVIEPVDPFEGGELHGFDVSPRASSMDHFGLVETVDALCQGVVLTVPDAAD